MKSTRKVKSEKRDLKKKKRRYPVSGRSVFTLARLARKRGAGQVI